MMLPAERAAEIPILTSGCMKAEAGREIAVKNTMRAERPALRIVLCGTTHPGNIGGAARAMKTMGLQQLVLVAPKAGAFPSAEATARAVSAADVLDQALVVDTLLEAVAGCSLVVGTTARERHIGPAVMLPRDFCAQAVDLAQGGEVALVFGRERTGLTNEEVDLCQLLLRIPTQEAFASLNLAAAVQILAYEWIQTVAEAPMERSNPYAPANAGQLEGFFQHLRNVVELTGFFAGKNQDAILRRMRKIYMRARLDVNEINILRGLLSQTEKAVEGRRQDPADPS